MLLKEAKQLLEGAGYTVEEEDEDISIYYQEVIEVLKDALNDRGFVHGKDYLMTQGSKEGDKYIVFDYVYDNGERKTTGGVASLIAVNGKIKYVTLLTNKKQTINPMKISAGALANKMYNDFIDNLCDRLQRTKF